MFRASYRLVSSFKPSAFGLSPLKSSNLPRLARSFHSKPSDLQTSENEGFDIYMSNVHDHVSLLLEETRKARKNVQREYVLNCFMQNEPGVLARCTEILSSKGYNIDSLVVSKTEVAGLSRMTLTLKGQREMMIQAQKQLEDLDQVWAVVDLTESKVVEREVLLVKASLIGPEFNLSNNEFHTPTSPTSISSPKQKDTNTSVNKPSEAALYNYALESNKRLSYLKDLASFCNAKIVNVGAEAAIVELCAKSEMIDLFLKLVQPFGILESARSGRMVMSSNAKLSFFDDPFVYKSGALKIKDAVDSKYPGKFSFLVNQEKPRRGSFQVTIAKGDK
ncbi:hypothetical protein BB560_003560, partial [Smittium megazygosporum]